MATIYDELNKLFGDVESQAKEYFKKRKETIAYNLEEDENEYKVYARVPGVAKEDISLSYSDSVLEIKVENKEDTRSYVVNEFKVTYDNLEVELLNADSKSIKAKLENGILVVTLSKKKENKTTIIID